MLFAELEGAGNIEPKMDVPAKEITSSFSNKCLFYHGRRIGQMQLENMAAGFDINSNGQGIPVIIRCSKPVGIKLIIIFEVNSYTFSDQMPGT